MPSCLGTFPNCPCDAVGQGHHHHHLSRTGKATRGRGLPPLCAEAGLEPSGESLTPTVLPTPSHGASVKLGASGVPRGVRSPRELRASPTEGLHATGSLVSPRF